MTSAELPIIEEENASVSLMKHPIASCQVPPLSKCPIHIRYRLPKISEKGAIIMIIWNFLFAVSFFSCSLKLVFGPSHVIVITSLTIVYPIVGWLADSWLGKYKFLQSAMYLLLVAIILKTIEMFFITSLVLNYMAVSAWSLSAICYIACVIQFTTDQSIGASGEELSFTIYWLLWGMATGELLARLAEMVENIGDTTGNFITFILSAISFALAFSFFQNMNKHLLKKPQISNPISIIVKVLNYARKHRYPEKRSALTYWEDDYPSRIDLGKEKYGGPFTTEEVEDVKTVLRLIPITISVTACGVAWFNSNYLQEMEIHRTCYNSSIKASSFHNTLFHNEFFIACIWATLGLPIFYFIIYPLFYNHIPSMLRRMGLSFLLTFFSYVGNVIIEFVEQANTNEDICMFDKNHTSTSVNNGCMWVLLPESLFSLGSFMLLFLLSGVSDCPNPMADQGVANEFGI